ncbi:MAG: AmmeMemoRadiSam system protein B [Chloroflexota bacterium]|nr:MAG: AmmeMemoRadiSam system protein B [Chloroflexota bacterium]
MDTRPSPIAGRWYPGDSRQLASSVDGYVGAAELPEINGEVIAVVAPHAGHIYSGPVAGYSFGAVQGMQFELVAVVSPMHQPYSQPLLTSAHQAYQTPLGSIVIDLDAVAELDQQLQAELGFGLTQVRNDAEHSLEIELPFLQRVIEGEFRLLPVMVRDQSTQVAEVLGKTLAKILSGKTALIVASTDLSHFYNQDQAVKLDQEMLRQLEAFDPLGFLKAEEEGKGFACGRYAVAAALWAAKELGANEVKILKHATSGEVTGDYTGVVGYAAAVITRRTSEVSLN